MSAYVTIDVDIHDMARYQQYMSAVRPAIEAAGGRYVVRGGAFKVYEGDWQPRRIVVLEFPSIEAWEQFYFSAAYLKMKAIRDECSSARIFIVEGIAT